MKNKIKEKQIKNILFLIPIILLIILFSSVLLLWGDEEKMSVGGGSDLLAKPNINAGFRMVDTLVLYDIIFYCNNNTKILMDYPEDKFDVVLNMEQLCDNLIKQNLKGG